MAAGTRCEPVDRGSPHTVFGFPFFAEGDPAAAAAVIVDRALRGQGGYACFAGVHGVVEARTRPQLAQAFEDSWMNFPDGAPVAWMMRRSGVPQARRLAGPDVMPLVCDIGRTYGLCHFLLGSTPAVLAELERRLSERYPGIEIAGTMSPPFRQMSDEEEEQATAEVMARRPHLIWVGLGLPKQDEWMRRNQHRYQPALALGVGAAFDFLAGNKPRAPLWMREHGLEWLHRLASEPRRLGPRYVRTNTEFMLRAG
ncbi:MAG TPA: WecB/TagA/CpsF family glycosyltransferase, partial [Thermoleophilia bacterium]|nr:WecB/TagA/CpsF family glycosyltransferase [Thermoleophilia bacterium]